MVSLRKGTLYDRDQVLRKLVDIQYSRNDMQFIRGTFRVKGDVLEIYPVGATEKAIRVDFFGDEVERILEFDALTGEILGERVHVAIFPATHYAVSQDRMKRAIQTIQQELDEQLKYLRGQDKLLEAQRLAQRTNYDIEMMQEMGYCTGIENY